MGSTNGSMWCMARSWRQRHRLAGGDKVHGIQGRVGGHGAWSGSDTRRTWWHSSNSSPRPTPTNSIHSVLTAAVLSRSTQGHPSLAVSQHSVPVLHTMPLPPPAVSVVHDVVLVAAASPQAPPGAATALTVTATVAAAASSRGSESSPRQAVSPQGAAYPVRLQRRQPGPIVVPKFSDLSTIVVVSVRLGEEEK